MMYKIRYLPLAVDDLTENLDYLMQKLCAPQTAAFLPEKLDKTASLLEEQPYAFPVYQAAGPLTDEVRKVPIDNYLLFYSVIGDEVEIRRFICGRRNIQNINI